MLFLDFDSINLFTYRKKIIYHNIEFITLLLSGIIFLAASIITIVTSKGNNLHYYGMVISIIGYVYMSLSNSKKVVKNL